MSNNPPNQSGASLNNIESLIGHDSENFGFMCDTLLTEEHDPPYVCNCSLPKKMKAINQLIKDAYQEGVESVVTLEQLEKNREQK